MMLNLFISMSSFEKLILKYCQQHIKLMQHKSCRTPRAYNLFLKRRQHNIRMCMQCVHTMYT